MSALLTKDSVLWQQVYARMLEEYESSKSSDPATGKEDKSEQAHSASVLERKRKVECYHCNKFDHIEKNCYKWKLDQKKKQDCEEKKDDIDDNALSGRSASTCLRAGNGCAMVAGMKQWMILAPDTLDDRECPYHYVVAEEDVN